MGNQKTIKKRDADVVWIIVGIPVISVVGSVMHFVYDWSGGLTIIGLFAPINESIWEHLKLIFWPSLVWWIVGYFCIKKSYEVSLSQWFCSGTTGLYIGPIFIVSFYYTYTGAFGIHSLFLDILSFIMGVATAQLFALHVYCYAKTRKSELILAGIAVFLFGAAFIIYTISPPEIPLFFDPSL